MTKIENINFGLKVYATNQRDQRTCHSFAVSPWNDICLNQYKTLSKNVSLIIMTISDDVSVSKGISIFRECTQTFNSPSFDVICRSIQILELIKCMETSNLSLKCVCFLDIFEICFPY